MEGVPSFCSQTKCRRMDPHQNLCGKLITRAAHNFTISRVQRTYRWWGPLLTPISWWRLPIFLLKSEWCICNDDMICDDAHNLNHAELHEGDTCIHFVFSSYESRFYLFERQSTWSVELLKKLFMRHSLSFAVQHYHLTFRVILPSSETAIRAKLLHHISAK